MKSKFWPRRPQKWPRQPRGSQKGLSEFFQKILFLFRAKHWDKWAIAWLPGQTFEITSFQHFLDGLEDTELKTGNFKSLTRKPSYSSFFSVLCPDLKNVFFGKIHWAPSEILEVAEAIFEVAEANFSIFNGFSFRIFVILSFEVIWPQRPRRPQKGASEFFQKLYFLNQCVQTKKMRYVTTSSSKFSLNLSTEEVWAA